MTTIALLDYGVGNLYSVANALTTAGADVITTNKPDDIKRADKILLPGVGAMRDAMAHMQACGIDVAVKQALNEKPVMAICVGMQAMFDYSTEGGRVECLGVIGGSVERFDDAWVEAGAPIKIPHVGWNKVRAETDHILWQGCNDEHFYFTHSYYCKPDFTDARNENIIAAYSDYGQKFCASIIKDNLFITQFHPEKSHNAGLRLLSNFINWKP
ncbi:imidazole glycerol phosphate synthase subunit HisH [Moraxella caviae]|uniref:Imidazole glycerol phosphate synthase subunit HisH n=1 Tax=Moraxella caviae TaxID=34060 RepID=A0A1S9ZXG7_9GAMM|nr:imidazole glycerol phosphate synthase subunit HisH [Moraxella caviae]OOR88150.1 imidazole glycerol phosphate synthase subunit HisH [Moraxella caviae]STZ10502.1 Imidazole glycerol phosphate synthase subunit HisH 1 [Moraxella caviae]VEW12529.1 Imidazole glycerol phosphate synthase subunit HisH 1 [Moraxella caviae]VEW13096.1 Imidazole glycerol phosphate synthase subunit HisH 1 [Moraxella caviae]